MQFALSETMMDYERMIDRRVRPAKVGLHFESSSCVACRSFEHDMKTDLVAALSVVVLLHQFSVAKSENTHGPYGNCTYDDEATIVKLNGTASLGAAGSATYDFLRTRNLTEFNWTICTYTGQGGELVVSSACVLGSSVDCYQVASYNEKMCTSVSPCDYPAWNRLSFPNEADCSGISRDFPKCQVDCDGELGSCMDPFNDEAPSRGRRSAPVGVLSLVGALLQLTLP